MAGIFISYRRDDSAYIASAINDRFQQRFGDENIFFDIDTIPLGVDFRDHIGGAVGGCDVLLVVIGDQWANAKDSAGELRLPQPTDYVRVEIESALQRNVPVVPVLVGNATMPTEAELPESIRALAFRNAAEVRAGRDLSEHLERLVRDVGIVAGITPLSIESTKSTIVRSPADVDSSGKSTQATSTSSAKRSGARSRAIPIAVVLVLIAGVVVAVSTGMFRSKRRPDTSPPTDEGMKAKGRVPSQKKDQNKDRYATKDGTVNAKDRLRPLDKQIPRGTNPRTKTNTTPETRDGKIKRLPGAAKDVAKDVVKSGGGQFTKGTTTKDDLTKSVTSNPVTKSPQGVDRTDAKATAAAILTAYKARDFKALAPLVSPMNAGIFTELAEQGEKHPRFESILSGWRSAAVQTWTGAVDAPRYDKGANKSGIKAIVRFEQKSLTPLVVIAMTFREGQWEFEDIESPPEVVYKRMSTERPE